MGLIQAKGRLFSTVTGRLKGISSTAYGPECAREAWASAGGNLNFTAGEATVISGTGIARTAARPRGYRAPHCWTMPRDSGGLAVTGSRILGVGTATATPAMGKLAKSKITAKGEIKQATGTLIARATALLQGSGYFKTDPAIQGLLNASATLEGSGDLTGAIQAIGQAVSLINGYGTVIGAEPFATGQMHASVLPYTELSPQNLASAVWNALSTSIGEPGTAGEQLAIIEAVLRNKMVTDPSAGTLTVYDRNGNDILLEGDLFEDVAGTTPYSGTGVNRRERLE